ncbi:uncharacterized protein L969DRAFT_92232 [Mixia osmundae IAM 14324]|uniref:uncharacterized protein n=1 Tax=Mixia osmundae (strain CBS 9802 / IAM 14324 / JCM 22182 / KY 12970) TaxID=764103 RepID=UPI0004A54673|nr:uncharacterized protein L969DRAFT_92232 [Mixia osmundae IAM 14324]KEI42808.1 hypothetical protein L969DRAFT_92232 [Mixia osmundae IAM 14324]
MRRQRRHSLGAPRRRHTDDQDYIVLGSDSGRIVVLSYDATTNTFVKLHQETFGKSGSRRVVPGQYLAVDPKGRSVMIAAMEKTKLVYILNRDAAANLTISSPLEANKAHAIIHSIVGLDVGFENPLFAALEVDYSESDQDDTGAAFEAAEKMLTYYELDLGLNHVIRRWTDPTDVRANMLIALPGGQSTTSEHFDGPSGVLVCTENYIIYKHQGVPEHRVPIPKRDHPLLDPDRGLLITASVMHRMKGDFFILVQSEEGDLYKVTVERQEEEVLALKIKYFDTVPVASSLCILRSGFLFVASEFGNHNVYQFDKLGDDGDEVSSADYPSFGMEREEPATFFKPRPLENLVLVDELDSLCPIVDAKVANVLGADAPQIITACGRGHRSSLKMLRHGLEVEEMVSSGLGFEPTGLWTTKLKSDDTYDSYIVLSAPAATIVLTIGESIEQASNSGLVENQRTLCVQQVGDDSIVQVHPAGFLRVRADGSKEVWPLAPERVNLAVACANQRQIVLATTSGDIIYLRCELDGEITVFDDRKQLGVSVTSMSIGELSEDRLQTDYLCVGCEDQTVRIISLQEQNCLETISIQALTALPSSICIAEILDSSVDKTRPTTFVNIGLQNGVLLRTVLDPMSGRLTDTRTRFLGTRPVKLRRLAIGDSSGVLSISSRTWVNYTHQGLLQFDPLISDPLDHATGLRAEVCPEGIIGVTGDTLRIFTLPKIGTKVKMDSIPLSLTPRRTAFHPAGTLLYMIQSDHRTLSPITQEEKAKDLMEPSEAMWTAEINGLMRAEAGQWSSCISIIDPTEPENATVTQIYLDNNEAAFSVAVAQFAERPGKWFLLVGTAQDTTVSPRTCTHGFIRTYEITEAGRSLELLHKTELDDVPLSIAAFQGRAVVGVGRALRLYTMGKSRLLRKSENKSFPAAVVSLQVQGSRIYASDAQDSVYFVAYKAADNRLLIFADDTQQRWITCNTVVDYDTVASGDKFGNVFVSRVDKLVSEDVDEDQTGAGILHEKPLFMGAPHRLQLLTHFNVGDILTCIQKVSLVAGGREILLYTCLGGTVGMLIPFISKEDVEFSSTLEMHMRAENPSIVGRDHLAYRGYYVPQKATVDGDLCETFALLPMQKQAQIAGELDRSVSEVLKKIDSMRILSSGW